MCPEGPRSLGGEAALAKEGSTDTCASPVNRHLREKGDRVTMQVCLLLRWSPPGR